MITELVRSVYTNLLNLLCIIRTRKISSKDIFSPVLILSPHPDDEVFGCGGLIKRCLSQNITIHVAMLTGGGESHIGCCSLDEHTIENNRRKLTTTALTSLGLLIENIHFFNFKDGHINERPSNEMNRLARLIDRVHPTSILVPHHGEGWADHLAVRKIGLELASENTSVWEYCVWMWYYIQHGLDWKNAVILKMNQKEHTAKLKAIASYSKFYAPCGNPWIGVLPATFMRANSKNRELFFKIK